jgi:hypothetical protein
MTLPSEYAMDRGPMPAGCGDQVLPARWGPWQRDLKGFAETILLLNA